jgi:hypothetical protein
MILLYEGTCEVVDKRNVSKVSPTLKQLPCSDQGPLKFGRKIYFDFSMQPFKFRREEEGG